MHPATKFVITRALREGSIMFIALTYAPFLNGIGVTPPLMSYINAAYTTTMLLAQVPTGVIADRFGRGLSLKIGITLLTLGHIAYAFACGFWSALLFEMLVGLGLAFCSGADEAWITSALAARGESSKLDATFANTQTAFAFTAIATGSLGGLVAAYDLRWPWVGAAVLSAASAVLTYAWMNDPRTDGAGTDQTRTDANPHAEQPKIAEKADEGKHGYLSDSLSILRRTPALQWIVALQCVMALSIPFFHYFPLVFRIRIGADRLPLAWVFIFGASALGSIMVRTFNRHLSNGLGVAILSSAPIVTGLGLIVLGKAGSVSGLLVGSVMREAAHGTRSAALPAFVQRRVGEKYRATFGSLQALITGTWQTALLVAVGGILATRPNGVASICSLWWQLGILMVAGGAILAVFRPKSVRPRSVR